MFACVRGRRSKEQPCGPCQPARPSDCNVGGINRHSTTTWFMLSCVSPLQNEAHFGLLIKPTTTGPTWSNPDIHPIRSASVPNVIWLKSRAPCQIICSREGLLRKFILLPLSRWSISFLKLWYFFFVIGRIFHQLLICCACSLSGIIR